MSQETLFRQKSMDRISSPEQLNDYLRVTGPSVWVIMAAIVLLLVGLLIWSASASIDSFVSASAVVADGSMTLSFDDEQKAAQVEPGMSILVGESASSVRTVGRGADGLLFAMADSSLADGHYEARVVLRSTQVLRLLFN